MSADSLSAALTALQRRFGPRAVQRAACVETLTRWPTGLPALDGTVLGGGLPRGRLTVLAATAERGPSGRLTLLQSLAALASRQGETAYVDVPGTLDPGFLADLDADLAACLVLQPGPGHWGRALAMARSLVLAGLPWLGVALDTAPLGAGWDHALGALAEAVSSCGAVGVVAAPGPLARPLAHAASLVLGCQAAGWHRVHGDVAGLRLQLVAVKSKVGAPGTKTALLLRYPRPFAAAEVVGLPTLVAPRPQPMGLEAVGA